MSREISCFIRFRHRGQNLANVSVRVLNTDIRATTDEQGIAELRFAENINELILVSLESEEYIESTQTCFAKQYQDKNNPYTILTQLANFAITNLTMYQEQTQDNTTKQIPIYTAQPYITNNQAQSNNTPISSNTQTHTTNATDSQHLICLQAHIQTLQGGKMSALQWGYYIKQSNENLKSKITIKDLKSFTFTSNDTYNTKISFDINAKFTYTITENNTQKEITDYLKDNQQLIIFAYRKSPAYTTSYGTPHTILTISQYPILKLTSKMLTILYTHTNATYTLKHSCDTHYLSENLKNERIYTLELRDSNLYIKDKESNKDIALMLTKEIPNIQEKVILLDSKDLQALQITLGLHTHRDIREVYMEVQRAKRPNFESVKRAYREITPFYNRDYQESYNRLYKMIIEKNTTNGIIQERINQIVEYYAYSESRYFRIGGNAYNQFINNMNAYYNTCALRVSYSLNQSTHPIKNMKKQVIGRGYKGKDNHTYYLGVPDIVELLNKNWKELSWNKSTYNQVKANIQCGCSEDFYQGMTTKQENIDFFTELQSIKRKGIVAMRGPNGFNHTTLWEVDNFVDVKLGTNDNYLLHKDIIVRDFYFWDLL